MNLNPEEIHIWSATIDERYEKLLINSFLSVNEKRNAGKLAYDIDVFLFNIRHNLLRIILSNYLDRHPSKIRFNSNHYQKPHVAHPNTNIQFNISNSSNRFVAAFCQYHTVGVDLEIIRNIENLKQLTTDYLTPNEAAWVSAHPDSMSEAAFFHLWSKKEALVKAIGKGLNHELRTIDVHSNKPVVVSDKVWFITPLTLFEDCAGAIAVNSPITKLSYYNTADLL